MRLSFGNGLVGVVEFFEARCVVCIDSEVKVKCSGLNQTDELETLMIQQ